MEVAVEKRQKEVNANANREMAAYIKNIQDTIYACKVFRTQGNIETTHLTDTDTSEVTHCIPKVYDWIMKAWMPLFRMYEFQQDPTWEAFLMEYENELRNEKET